MSNLPQFDIKTVERFYIVLLIKPNSAIFFLDLPEQTTKLIFLIATDYIKFSKCTNKPSDCNIVESTKYCVINIYDNLSINEIINKLLKNKIVYIQNCETKTNYLEILKNIKESFEQKWLHKRLTPD